MFPGLGEKSERQAHADLERRLHDRNKITAQILGPVLREILSGVSAANLSAPELRRWQNPHDGRGGKTTVGD